MKYHSRKLSRLITQLSMLPGIGEKSAEKLALHIVKLPKERSAALADAIRDASQNSSTCRECCCTSDSEVCPVCASPQRDHKTIMVVENDDDMAQIERTGAYSGVYHVLQGVMDPVKGIGPNGIRLAELIRRLARTDVDEVILAMGASPEGDDTAAYISSLIKPAGIKVTQLANGIPIGTDIESADAATLDRAFRNRSTIQEAAAFQLPTKDKGGKTT